MSNLFDKLNTLVNAQVNDLLGKKPASPLARVMGRQGADEKRPRHSARGLRQSLEEALAYEDELEAKIAGLFQEAASLDEAVDQALNQRDEIGARRLQSQLNQKQQQLAIAESELRDHRRVTRHLVDELRKLESALGQEAQTAPASDSPRRRIPVDDRRAVKSASAANPSAFIGAVTDKLDEARDGLDQLLNNSPLSPPEKPGARQNFEIIDEAPDPRQPKPRHADKREMQNRLSRLSKPDAD